MSTPSSQPEGEHPSLWAVGLSTFAATMLLIVGCFQFFEGLVAVFNDNFYVVAKSYTFNIDTTAYGWTHMLIGAVLVAAGIGVVLRQTWARLTGIAVAAVSMVVNFTFVPYYPLWSIAIIALDVAVIWALATMTFGRGRESGQV